MAPRTLILIPPSEGKTEGGTGPTWAPATMAVDLDEQRLRVLDALGTDHPARTGPTTPAIERYRGVLYDELDASSIRGPARRRLNERVLIVSGLWGLVAPKDPIPWYKQKMGASLPPLGRLSTWWRPAMVEALHARARGAIVWDLLPNEHAAAIDWSDIPVRHRVTIRFLDRGGRTVSHWNKLLKGSIVRWLAETGESDPAALTRFDHPRGYRLDEAASIVGDRRSELVLQEQTERPSTTGSPEVSSD